MKNTLILASFLALAPFAKGQLLLEALEGGQNEKCLERVKDKYYGDGDHNFIYCAVMGPGNKKWLNLNLGAEYAREGSEYFNPEAVPTDHQDWKAFGSLYNYNRDSDGHELVQYRRGTSKWEVKHKNGYTTNRPNAGEKSNIVASEAKYYAEWELSNDPCPNGYRVVDSSLLVGTTGYTWEGLFSGTSIMKHNSYSSWTLVTAPAWSDSVWSIPDHYGDTYYPSNEDYVATNSTLAEARYGTSGLWLGKSVNPIRNYVNNTWVIGYDSGADTRPQKTGYFDRGIVNQNGGRIAEYGISNSYASAVAVRCVEK